MSAALDTLPGVRDAAERMARELYAAVVAQRSGGDTRPFDALPAKAQEAEIRAHLALLCDVTRPASMDWWARYASDRLGNWQPWEIARAVHGDHATLAAICRQVGIEEPGRWEPHPPAAESMRRICLAAGGAS